jgi:hypothetical protein
MSSEDAQIATLKITLSGPRQGMPECSRTIETRTDTTLRELHWIIQDAVQFDDDHMYQYFLGPRWSKQTSFIGNAAHSENAGVYDQVRVHDIFPLEKGIKLFYQFDLGDSWYFAITSRPTFKPPSKRCKYPRTVAKVGRNPRQYAYE